MTNYNLNGTYILKQKYIFGLFYTHTSDYFAQTPYQATGRLALIYKNTNWNYMRMIGVNVILPLRLIIYLSRGAAVQIVPLSNTNRLSAKITTLLSNPKPERDT